MGGLIYKMKTHTIETKENMNDKVFVILNEIETNINNVERINADKHIIKCCCDC